MPTLLLTCRAGFEGESAQELQAHFAALGVAGFARCGRDHGYLLFESADGSALPLPNAAQLIFPRQCLAVAAHFKDLDPQDRIGPILAWLGRHINAIGEVWTEAPDSPAGEQLHAFCRSFESALVARLKRENWLAKGAAKRLLLFFTSATECYLCLPEHSPSALRQGILRLRFPGDAPSRSTLKLEEAFLTLLSAAERESWLQAGMSAVDLGASPGGWTYQLVRRSIQVSAVDNGPIAETLLASGLVNHIRADGFRFRPKKPVDWLVCDMVEQPIRVANLIADWLRDGACRRALFNLKLPMKERWPETQRCLAAVRENQPFALDLRAKQLYHDREEITVYAGPA